VRKAPVVDAGAVLPTREQGGVPRRFGSFVGVRDLEWREEMGRAGAWVE